MAGGTDRGAGIATHDCSFLARSICPRGLHFSVLRAQSVDQASARDSLQQGDAPKVVVVGAGFAGLGGKAPYVHIYSVVVGLFHREINIACLAAAYHLSKEGYNVTLLDSSPSPGGIIKDRQGQSIDAGIKGFWYQVSIG